MLMLWSRWTWKPKMRETSHRQSGSSFGKLDLVEKAFTKGAHCKMQNRFDGYSSPVRAWLSLCHIPS